MGQKGWKRTGVALSVVWFLAAGFWGNSMGLHKGDFAARQFHLCLENSANPGSAAGACLTQFDTDYTQAIKNHWWDGLIAGGVPIIVVYGLIGFMRRRRMSAQAAG